MLIGIMSDSHDHLIHTEKAFDLFDERGVDIVYHLGDYVAPSVPRNLFNGRKYPIKGIHGNNDGDVYRLMLMFQSSGAEYLGEFAEVEHDGLRLALYHGTHQPLVEALALCRKYDIVLRGHTHQHEETQFGDVTVFNPGSVHGFADEASVGFFDTSTRKFEKFILTD